MDNSNNSNTNVLPEIVTTGLVLPDGAILEQLAGGQLICSIGGSEQVGTSIEHGGIRFIPATFGLDFERALLLPDGTAEYGSVALLLKDIAVSVRLNTGLDEQESLLVAGFVLATWMPEFLPLPPILNVWGQRGMDTTLRDLLNCLCRHALTIAAAVVPVARWTCPHYFPAPAR